MDDVTFRAGRPEDIPSLQQIERDAGQMFRTHDMDAIADDDPPSVESLERAMRDETLIVAEANGAPIGYVMARRLTASLHIDQVTVHPQFGRRGIGKDLLDRTHTPGVPLTLTTFRDVPWNAPYYAQLGFEPLEPELIDNELAAIVAEESARGLDRWPRVVMRKA